MQSSSAIKDRLEKGCLIGLKAAKTWIFRDFYGHTPEDSIMKRSDVAESEPGIAATCRDPR